MLAVLLMNQWTDGWSWGPRTQQGKDFITENSWLKWLLTNMEMMRRHDSKTVTRTWACKWLPKLLLCYFIQNVFYLHTYTRKANSLAFDEIKIIPREIITANTYTVLSLRWPLFNALCILINPVPRQILPPFCRWENYGTEWISNPPRVTRLGFKLRHSDPESALDYAIKRKWSSQ